VDNYPWEVPVAAYNDEATGLGGNVCEVGRANTGNLR
jgi:hypothetical protein